MQDTQTPKPHKTGPSGAVPTGAAYYVYDEAGKLLGEYDANQKPIYETVYLGVSTVAMPIGVMKQTGAAAQGNITTSLYDVYADHINTPRMITRPSDNAIVWRWDTSEAFGATMPDQNPSGLGTFAFNQRFPGQVFDAETGLFDNWNRTYDARLGRYRQSDPIGLKAGINTYEYVSGDPLNYSDPEGLLAQGIVDFGAGMGDVLLLGQGQRLRDLLDVDGGVDQCSGEYSAGEWAGIAGSFATGLVGGVIAAGVKAEGMEFSHAIPARVFRPSSKSYSATLDAAFGWAEKTILNGNYVTPLRHYLHDPFRYPKGWRDFGEKLPSWLQQLDRIPNVFKGGAAGAAYGAAGSAMNGCTCKK